MTEESAATRPVQSHETLVHGACVARDGQAVLLRGPSGAGKSDLALRFSRHDPRNVLVADDQVLLDARAKTVWARPHPALAGLIEVRGIGIVRVTFLPRAELRLIVDLTSHEEIDRLPPDPPASITIGAATLPMLRLAPFENSAPLKLALAIEWAIGLASRSEHRQR